MSHTIKCQRCGKIVTAASGARRYCNDCAGKAAREQDIRRKLIRQYADQVVECTCTDCGRIFYAHMRFKKCFYCARDRDPWQSTVGYCSENGQKFTICRECAALFVAEGAQRICSGCAELKKQEKAQAGAKAEARSGQAEAGRLKKKRRKAEMGTPMEREMAQVKGPNAAIRRTMVAAKYAGYGASYGRYVADHGGEI